MCSRPLTPLADLRRRGHVVGGRRCGASAEPEGQSTRTNTIRPVGLRRLHGPRLRRGARATRVRRTVARRRQARPPEPPALDVLLRPAHRPAAGRRDVARAHRLRRSRPVGTSAPPGARRRPWAPSSSTRSSATSTATGRAACATATGSARRLGWAITTGDLADNQQKNETKWIVDILEGNNVDPFSGKPISPTNPCRGSAEQTARLNSDVANRRYTGVQDYSDYPSAPADAQARLLGPVAAASTTARTPPSPATRACSSARSSRSRPRAWRSRGTRSRGNHDGLIQGNAPATPSRCSRRIATGCLKVFPSASFDPDTVKGQTGEQVLASWATPPSSASCWPAPGARRPTPTASSSPSRSTRPCTGTTNKGHGFDYSLPVGAGCLQRQRQLLRLHAQRPASASSRSTRWPRAGPSTATSTSPSTAGSSASSTPAPPTRSPATGGWSATAIPTASSSLYGHHTLAHDDQPAHRRGSGRAAAATPPTPAATATRAPPRRCTAA